VSDLTGGVASVIGHAAQAGKLEFFPAASLNAWIPFVGAGVTMMLGSIPQQDVFQRITSAKDERTAVRGSLLGAALYFCFCFVPMFIAYSALLIDPVRFGTLLERDSQLVLPTLIVEYTPAFAQVMFFGAVLSAVMSCSSATLLAPSVILSENVIKEAMPQMDEWALLRTMRMVLVCFAAVVLAIALGSESSIYKLVVNTYKVTLVSAFVPLAAGLFWKGATTQGALCAIVAGLVGWLGMEFVSTDASVWPPQLVGLLMAALGMVFGSQVPSRRSTQP
jgi:solute:Na+ symporter, SSS family